MSNKVFFFGRGVLFTELCQCQRPTAASSSKRLHTTLIHDSLTSSSLGSGVVSSMSIIPNVVSKTSGNSVGAGDVSVSAIINQAASLIFISPSKLLYLRASIILDSPGS